MARGEPLLRLAGSLALAIIAIPVIVRTTEDMLRLVPTPLREASAALGMPKALIVQRIAYRAAFAGMTTGVLLAISRISGEDGAAALHRAQQQLHQHRPASADGRACPTSSTSTPARPIPTGSSSPGRRRC